MQWLTDVASTQNVEPEPNIDSPVHDQEIPGHKKRLECNLIFTEGQVRSARDRFPNLDTSLFLFIRDANVQILSRVAYGFLLLPFRREPLCLIFCFLLFLSCFSFSLFCRNSKGFSLRSAKNAQRELWRQLTPLFLSCCQLFLLLCRRPLLILPDLFPFVDLTFLDVLNTSPCFLWHNRIYAIVFCNRFFHGPRRSHSCIAINTVTNKPPEN